MPTVQDLQAEDDAYAKQVSGQQSTKASQEALQAGQDQQPSLLQKWGASISNVTGPMIDSALSQADAWGTAAKRVGQDVAAGGITAGVNMADAAHSFVQSAVANAGRTNSDRIADVTDPANAAREANYDAPPSSPIWDHAKAAVLDFRDAVAVKDPNMVDNLTQSVAQLAIPFTGFSRTLAGLHGFASMAAAGALTDSTALGPHDMRMADLVALGRTTEGRLGDALRTLAPDGGAVNAYINYLTDRGNESEAEGRFKNVLDGFGANLIATPLMHSAAMVLKQGTAGLRYLIDNGVGSSGGLAGNPATQVGAVGDLSARRPALQQGADPAESLYDDQVRRDADAAAANPSGKRPPLIQGGDPASSLYDAQVRQDMENAAPMAAPKNSSPEAVSSLESTPAVTSFSRVLRAQATEGNYASVSDVASTLAKHLPDDGAEGSFYKDVLQRVSSRLSAVEGTGSRSLFSVSANPNVKGSHINGQYATDGTDKVTLYPSAFENNTRLVHTFAHEAVHAAVFHDIESSPITRTALDDLRKQVAAPIDEHNTALTKALRDGSAKPDGTTNSIDFKPKPYGTTNVQEFVAEAESNPSFRKTMQDTRASDGRSVWENYKDTIAGMLGVGGVVAASPMFDKLLTKEKKGA